jgi:hypothetical protein
MKKVTFLVLAGITVWTGAALATPESCAVFWSDLAFIEQQYQDFYGHPRDPEDIYYQKLQNEEITRPQVMDRLLQSDKHYAVRAPIAQLYHAYFDRFPDYNGFNFWVDMYRYKTWTPGAISDAFAYGSEFYNLYGWLSDAQFIAQVCWNIYKSHPCPVAIAFDGQMTRGQAVLLLLENPDLRSALKNRIDVTLAYAAVFRRAADSSGGPFWVGQLDGGLSVEALFDFFYHSQEYYNRFCP